MAMMAADAIEGDACCDADFGADWETDGFGRVPACGKRTGWFDRRRHGCFMTEIRIFPTAAAAAAETAREIIAAVTAKPDLVLGVATGATVAPVYRHLVASHRAGLSFAGLRCFSLDEYVGLPATHKSSYRAEMRAQFYGPVGLDPSRCFAPDGMAADPDAEAARFEAAVVAAGGVDLQLLGIGVNGHIGFNEPPADFARGVHVTDLAPATLAANRGFFDPGEIQPVRAITMGVRTILSARKLLLVATGRSKRDAVAAALRGPVSPDCPASSVQMHINVLVILDADAASGL